MLTVRRSPICRIVFCLGVWFEPHRDWLRRHGAHSQSSPASQSPPFACGRTLYLRVLSLTALKTKKLPSGSFLLLVRAQGFEPWTH